MVTNGAAPARGKRIDWMDNLRTFMVFLVVLYHAGGVYESSGLWGGFWLVDDPATNDLAGILNVVLNIFMMPVLFFISGYLTPPSLDRKGSWGLLVARFKRLIIPWIIAVLILMPLYHAIFLYSRGLPQQDWTAYFHFSPGTITSQNWLWFLPVLFLFNIVYALLAKVGISLSNISRWVAVLGTLIIGLVTSMGVGFLLGQGSWTKTPCIDFENERLLAYFVVFLLGALYFRKDAFAVLPKGKVLYIIACATAWIPVTIFIFALLLPLFSPAGYVISPAVDRLVYWLSFYVSLLCMMYLVIESFWRYLDRSGRIWQELNRNAFYVYIIHVIVIGVVALLLLNTALPSVVKYVMLAATAYLASNLIVSLARRAVVAIKAR